MNTPNDYEQEVRAHSYLKRALPAWAKTVMPSIRVRHELMRTVREESLSQWHRGTRLPSDGFLGVYYLGPVIGFNHCLGLLNSLQARARL